MNIAPFAWPLIGVIGAAGALLRVGVDGAVERRTSHRFPFGTLAVNLSGAAALGLMHGLGAGGSTALLVGTAGLGSYTTFSTLVFETERLLEEGDRIPAVANILGSILLGLVVVTLGWVVGGAL
jgi:CrcB protein